LCPTPWNGIFTSINFTANKETIIDTLKSVKLARTVIDEKKGEDIVILDVRNVSTVTDYYVICTGNNTRHLKAIADDGEKQLALQGVKLYRQSGTPESGWMIIDYLDFVVHIFSEKARKHYALETLWKDAPKVK